MKRRSFVRSTLAASAVLAIPRRPLEAFYREALSKPRALTAVTGDGRDVTLSSAAIADLKGRLRGRLLLADDSGYDQARRILNPSFDKYPALVVQPTGVADIRTAVDFARDNGGLLLAVKCGGHSHSGKSTCDRGMQIDLSRFRDVRVDLSAQTGRVTGGSLLGQLDHEAMAHGLVVPMGTVSHTGVGGLVTGGGFGRLARRFGLSVDSLLSVDVVTADSELRHASASENPGLFWGVRGGGGNFGIVTSFQFQLHAMQRQVLGGAIFFPLSRARDVLRLYGDYGPEQPDELQLDLIMAQSPGGPPVAGFGVCYSGDPNKAEAALAPVRGLGTPIIDSVAPTDYVALQRSGDTDDPRAVAGYMKSGFLTEMPQGLIDALVEGFQGHPDRTTQVVFQQSGGKIARVSPDATAFAQRDAIANMLPSVGWSYGDNPDEHIAWCREYWTHLEPFTHGFYTNDGDEEATNESVAENYQQNIERLTEVKNRYDPENLFRLNANVLPTV
ncbi:MAG: FAD-binding protein [Gemmatimonadota bacterium]|nr:FAD-binding protein [Gemmatimonadota bacterium]